MPEKSLRCLPQRPVVLTLLAVFLALVPVFNVFGWLIIYWAEGRNVQMADSIAIHLGTLGLGFWGVFHFILQIIIWSMFIVSAIGIFRMRTWGFYIFITTVIVNRSFSMLIFPEDLSSAANYGPPGFDLLGKSALANFMIFLPVVMLIKKDLMAPFFNPRLKWWGRHHRVRRSLTITAHLQGEEHVFHSFDVSLSGLFLVTDLQHELSTITTFPASIHLDKLNATIAAQCRIMWVNDGQRGHPPGLGCMFMNLDRASKNTLKRYIAQQVRNDFFQSIKLRFSSGKYLIDEPAE